MKIVDKVWEAGTTQKPNEDWFNQIGKFAWVFDGITAIKPNPTSFSPRWLVEEADKTLAKGAESCNSLQELLDYYSDNFNAEQACLDLGTSVKPNFAMALVHLDGNKLDYVVFGDCSVVIKDDNEIRSITDPVWADRTASTNTEEFFAQPKEKQIDDYCAIRETMNTPEGYLIGTADGRGMKMASPQNLILEPNSEILLCSDGFERVVNMFHLYSWKEVFSNNLSEMTSQLRHAEEEASQQAPRWKIHDDTTAIKLKIK